MKSLRLFLLALLLGLFIGCEPDPCEFVECGPGECSEGICECPDGFSGVNCEIAECSGVACINGDCDPQTESCHCDPNYYGEACDKLCVNGEFANGDCNCSEGYEGFTCETESRDSFVGWWSCIQWTWTSQTGDSTFQGPLLGSIKFECGNSIPEIEFFPTQNSSGLMLLSLDDRIVGQLTEKTINFELQYLSPEVSVYGSASLGDDLNLIIELNFLNHTTSLTEVARGTFRIHRHYKDCN